MVVLIGRDWLDATGPDGKRRIHDTSDYVRVEIEGAMAREMRIIPALVDGAEMPIASDLPPALRPLTTQRSIDIRRDHFLDDILGPLVAEINRLMVERGPSTFLCHSSGDKERVRALYRRLTTGGVRCWFDEEDLLPGEDWDLAINKAIRGSQFVAACLSKASISKAGYIQKELRRALDLADEQPEGSIFLIPVRLEECDIPDRLRRWQWVDLFKENGYERLLRVLRG